MEAMLEYYYFTGDCNKTQDQIRGMFHRKLADHIDKYCSKAECSVEDIEVICHGTQERKRRDTSYTSYSRRPRLYKRDQTGAARVLKIRFKIVGVIQKSNITEREQFKLRRILGRINLEIKKLDNLNITSNVSNLIGDLSVSQYSSGKIEIQANCGDKNMVTVQSSTTKMCCEYIWFSTLILHSFYFIIHCLLKCNLIQNVTFSTGSKLYRKSVEIT